MRHYVFATIDKNTGEIINCWEQPSMPEGVENPLRNDNAPANWEVVQIDVDTEIDNIKIKSQQAGYSISGWIVENQKIDITTLKSKGKITIGKLKIKDKITY